MRLALQCLDIEHRRWTYEYVSIWNFWHKWLWNKYPKFMPHQTDGIHCDFKPKTWQWRDL